MSLPSSNNGDRLNPHHILVVEDDPTTRRLYRFLLINQGFVVHEAEDGVGALEKLSTAVCSLVITDMNMPRMDGMELTRHVRERYPQMLVIMVTAYSTPETERQAFKAGANDYLAKPFEFDELERRVRRLLTHVQEHGT